MELHFGKNTLLIHRQRTLGFGICRNIGFGEINRRDRQIMKVAYLAIYLRAFVIDFSRQIAPW